MDGILPVYKKAGISSFDVIREFKKNNHPSFKIGHGGTLDPFADGVLLLLLGKATKQMNELAMLPKTYIATARLGAKSETLDRTGTIEKCHSVTVSQQDTAYAVSKFVGEIEQEIPDYSATKINGVPRYELARKGIAMPKKSKLVTIHSIKNINIMEFDGSNHRTEATMEVMCSSGTYIRQLSYDIFKTLGIESYLESLTRTAIGNYKLDNCSQIDDFSGAKWQDKVVQLPLLVHDESISHL